MNRKIITMKQTTLRVLLLLLLFTHGYRTKAQQNEHGNIHAIFSEIEAATKNYVNLWDKNLYGAMLLINPETRELFANEPDSAGVLKPDGSIYSGILPDNFNFGNTALEWNGKRWAMIMLPLPENKYERITLLAHELFHKAQPSLGFILNTPENNHLDTKEGRIYLRLELEALKNAIQSTSENEMLHHLSNAIIFRKYRNLIFPGSDKTENLLEIHEGIAEFTGFIISERDKEQTTAYFVNGINSFFRMPTFVRSFAYFTTPLYSYMLYSKDKNWNKNVTNTTDLTDYFIKTFNIRIPTNLDISVVNSSDYYNGKAIIHEETAREEENKRRIAEYKHRFTVLPHLALQLEERRISFDPRNILPIEDIGTVYPNIRVTDIWGVLTVENGALMSPFWDKITISAPKKIEGKNVMGDGWTLELTDKYIIEKEETSGNYKLTKVNNFTR